MNQQPSLTLLEEFLLLALDDRACRLYPIAGDALDHATAGALLMDLTLRNRVDNDLREIFVVDATPVGDDLLDPILQMMSMVPVLTPRPMADWVRQLGAEGQAYREKAFRRLESHGIVRREDRKILWMFKDCRYPLVIAGKARDVKARVLRVVRDDEIPAPHDVMLIALAQACGLFRHLLGMVEAKEAAVRINQIAGMDLIGQAVAQTANAADGSKSKVSRQK